MRFCVIGSVTRKILGPKVSRTTVVEQTKHTFYGQYIIFLRRKVFELIEQRIAPLFAKSCELLRYAGHFRTYSNRNFIDVCLC
jgi:hypothetical protein